MLFPAICGLLIIASSNAKLDISFIDIDYEPHTVNRFEYQVGDDSTFPQDFQFGAASAAYQVEGAWNVDGKEPSIWDSLCHWRPDLIVDNTTGDDATKAYELYQDDVRALKAVGFNFYRFSIAWSRVLPTGEASSRNQRGIDYYNRLIDSLIAEGIQPMVTMFHWDLPQQLQDYGGMLNPMIVEFFANYANLLFHEFGDRVKHWITFNEPSVSCGGWEYADFPPLISVPGIGEYLCSHHVILSHAAAYRLYQTSYRSKFGGKVGITLASVNYYKLNPQVPDAVIDRAFEFALGNYMHPIFKDGDYPKIMIDEIAANSKAEGRTKSRLPQFTEAQKVLVKGSADFLGFNYYSSRLTAIDDRVNRTDPPSTYKDGRIQESVDSKWPRAKSSWLYSVPTGIRDGLRWIKANYDDPEIWITENGWSDDGEMNDVGRIDYYRRHLQEALKAIVQDGVKLKGYTFWSLTDNFEWLRGLTEKFGVYSVNFTSPSRERTPKASAGFLRQVIATRKVPN